MKVKELLDLLEKVPVEREELMEMEIRLKVPAATGQCVCTTGIKGVQLLETGRTKHLKDDRGPDYVDRFVDAKPEYALEITTSFAT